MRAKEYINVHKQDLKHAEIVSQIIEDLQPLRMDKKATCEYMKNRLRCGSPWIAHQAC